LANPEHVAKLKEGVEAWNKWRLNRFDFPDLSKADLHETNMSGADLFRASLHETNLRGADLSRADFSQASLSGSDLSRSNCRGADFNQAYLAQANFSGADLAGADLSEADLSEIDLSWAKLEESDFDDAFLWGGTFISNDLSTVRNLKTIRHQGRSTIDLDTIYMSQGKIPAEFLRGAGIPDEFIAYIESLTAKPLKFYSCFISYSAKDDAFTKKLHTSVVRQAD
jgi:uncharacterized protein YjbI with pentapeptide repeats